METTLAALTSAALFDLSHTLAAPLLAQVTYPWEVLDRLGDFLRTLGEDLPASYRRVTPHVWVHETATVAPTAYLGAGVIVGAGAEIRHGAFLRGNVLVGAGAVVGNSTEVKNSILFDGVQVPHYNYIGDGVLGYKAHLGAGAVTSNVKSDRTPVTIAADGHRLETHRKKLGAILGDGVEVGCGSVLNPGTVIGKGSRVYPLCSVRGFIPEGHICKAPGVLVKIEDRQP